MEARKNLLTGTYIGNNSVMQKETIKEGNRRALVHHGVRIMAYGTKET